MKKNGEYEYDVALSFAGEDRKFVALVAKLLKNDGLSVFYDNFEEANLWGKNLYDHLTEIYSIRAKYAIMFISKHYEKKVWTNLERQAMQSRAFQENKEYILPARFDDTKIPGLLDIVGYIDISKISADEFARIIIKKVKQI